MKLARVPDAPGYWVRWCGYSHKPQQIERFILSNLGIELDRVPGVVFKHILNDDDLWQGPFPEPKQWPTVGEEFTAICDEPKLAILNRLQEARRTARRWQLSCGAVGVFLEKRGIQINIRRRSDGSGFEVWREPEAPFTHGGGI